MKILIFHPSVLPPQDYGGTERVVLWLAKGLHELGHEVLVAAFRGSRLPLGVRLLDVPREAPSSEWLLGRLPQGTDVVHFMAPPSERVWRELACPGILTVHGNGQVGEKFPLNSVFLSKDHARRHGSEVFVYNGIDPSEYAFAPDMKSGRFLFLSKTSWGVKNLAGAIRVCQRAGVSLQISGGRRPYTQRLRAWVTPGLEWVGPVAGEKKAQLLARAKALVFPILWPEPFGLAVVEALVSGTPVLASPLGSMPELLPEQAGFLLKSQKDWVGALRGERGFPSPEACRSWAIQQFHYKNMASRYLELYTRLRSGGSLQDRHPVGHDWRQIYAEARKGFLKS